MNKNEIKKYNEIKKKTLTTSEVIRDSFVNVINNLKVSDYVVVKNNRQQIDMVIQDIDTFVGIEKTAPKSFTGKVTTSKENILLLRSYIKESVYYLMRFEDKNITFPEVDTIMNNSTYYKDKFIMQITKQLEEAYKYIMNLPTNIDADQFMHLQGIIARGQALEYGKLRSGQVAVSGTEYIPSLPKKKNITEMIEKARSSKNKYKAIATLLVKMIKAQPFWDGNKRSSFLLANRLMIENGLGLVVVKDKDLGEFNQLLNNYYNKEESLETLVSFVIDHCMFNTIDKKLLI